MSKINKILSSILILTVFSLPNLVFADSLIDLQKKALELQGEIDKLDTNISQTQKKKQTLKRDISILNDEISEAKLKIQQTSLAIQMTELAIGGKQVEIEKLEQESDRQKTILAEHIRMVNYYDQDSLLEILLSKENLSDVLSRIEALEVLQKQIHQTLEIIRANKALTLEDKQSLETQEEEQVALRKLQDAQKRSLQTKEQNKNKILAQTKGQEAEYQKMLSQTKTELQQVKSQIRLLQSEGKEVLSLDEAIDLANEASKLTGVRSALILAILDQESDFNRFTGACNYKTALRSGHDYEEAIFEDITKSLGLNPNEILVSCPLKNSKGEYVGSGGAMGPAQFMPKTWVNMQDELESLLGYTANPWMPRDAIIAMALYLKRNNALNNERQAAGAYFGKCSYYGVDYCNSVLALAKAYQAAIDARV
ncbi:MAG: lytic murein transglycosylase [bacterium]